MATSKSTRSKHRHTRELLDFPEVKGKIVQSVEVFSGSEYYAVTIRFEDRTALNFALETAVFAFPVLADWTGGNENILRKYRAVRSKVQRL